MNALSLVLESFDESGKGGAQASDVRLQQEKAAAYAKGFAAGEIASKAKQAEDREFLEAIREKFAEELKKLRTEQSIDLCDAFRSLVENIFPALCENGFADEAITALKKANDLDLGRSIIVKVAHQHVDLLRDIFSDSKSDVELIIEPDKEMAEFSIAAQWDNAGFKIDLDESLRQCLNALEQASDQLRKEG